MKELLFKALMSGLLRKITANEFVVLFGYLCGMNDINTFEHTFNIRQRTLERLRLHLYQLGLFDKDGRQYKLNVDNTLSFLQQFVDSDKIDVESKDSDKIAGQNEPNDIPIEFDGVEDKLSYMKNYFKELHSYPNGDAILLQLWRDDWIKALDALKEACGGFTECLTHFEVNLGEHTIKTKY